MKSLVLKNSSYEHLEKAFGEWLDILGYCPQSVDHMPTIIREFLHYLEQQNCHQITQLKQIHYKAYFNHISSRGNQRRGGALSNNYVNKHIQAIEKFLEFLHHKGVQEIPASGIRQLKTQRAAISILSTEEIQELYKLTEQQSNTSTSEPDYKREAISARDRVILTVFYSCGLRRNEGANLLLNNINFDTRLLHVRKGKNYKERFVPFSKTNAKYLEEYIYDHRPNLVKSKQESSLFIAHNSGKKMTGGALYIRLKLLLQRSENTALQEKNIGLHSLRHSIATHLLQAGMELHKIQKFLGHSSLESTQIYTHLIKQENEHI